MLNDHINLSVISCVTYVCYCFKTVAYFWDTLYMSNSQFVEWFATNLHIPSSRQCLSKEADL